MPNYNFAQAPPPGQAPPLPNFEMNSGVDPQDELAAMMEQFGFSDAQAPVNKFKLGQEASSNTIQEALAQMKAGQEKRPLLDKIMSIANVAAFIGDKTGKNSTNRRFAGEKFSENQQARQGREANRIAKLRQQFTDKLASEELLGKDRQNILAAEQSAQKTKLEQKGLASRALNVKKNLAAKEPSRAEMAIESARKSSDEYVSKNGFDAMVADPVAHALYLKGHPEMKGNSLLDDPNEKFADIQTALEKEVMVTDEYTELVFNTQGQENQNEILDEYIQLKVGFKMKRRYPNMFPSDEQFDTSQFDPAGLPSIFDQLPANEDLLPAQGRQPKSSGLKEQLMNQGLDEETQKSLFDQLFGQSYLNL